MAAHSSRLRSMTGWLMAAAVGFAAGTATAWVLGPGTALAGEPVQRLEFPKRQIAQTEWLRGAPAPMRLETMFRRPARR